MSNETAASNYPPLPSIRGFDSLDTRYVENLLETHGHACAEHARAPLVARIAELETRTRAQSLSLRAAESRITYLRSELAAKAGEVEKYRAGAERYWWLRDDASDRQLELWMFRLPEDQDRYVDAAIAARKGEGE